MAGKTILIVDDEERTREGLKKRLEVWSSGAHDIISACDGKEALQHFQQKKIHLMITDVNMPEMSGLQLLKTLRVNGKKPVVIIVSGYPDFQYAQEAIRLGVINYLLKPVNKQKLIEAVEEALAAEESLQKTEYMEKAADQKLIQMEDERIGDKDHIKQALSFIEKHSDKAISLKEAADSVHLNPSYFSVLFKEQTGLTFTEYVTRKRLQRAKRLLLTTQYSVEEIAEAAGYQTAKYFIKLFKEYEGITPSKYRKHSNTNDV
ncbi:response regulator transcription factor [Fictibacillus fluitans]|uniref:Response regulator n=1 Tax=Fictibacillus fluitans TaxID=3058422 RepID=A0ABT8HZK2_9BACL|nr:response regulator [Fictibacillus sp. NE201]MDN4525692.1 response regulator [Fictibacillus sp. NE201]